MEVIKRYLVWIILAVVLVALLVVQWIVVGGQYQQAADEHQQVVDTEGKAKKLAKNTTDYPSKGDLEMYGKHLERIKKERLEVQKLWRTATDALNQQMVQSDPEDPESWKIVRADNSEVLVDAFPEFIRREAYEELYLQREKAFAEFVQPAILQKLADDLYASKSTSTREEALKDADLQAAKKAEDFAHIWQPDKLIPVQLDDTYATKEDIWMAWRHYLITRDILRILTSVKVEVKRTINAKLRMEKDSQEGKNAKGIGGEDEVDEGDVGTTVLHSKWWRFVERVDKIAISKPVLGNHELDLVGKKSEKEARIEARKEKEDFRYHDVFDVEIHFVAHLKVLHAIMREILKSEHVFYVPQSISIQRFADDKTMTRGEKKGSALDKSTAFLFRPAREIHESLEFDYEPPVEAVLRYQIYRFRYTDTANAEAK